MSNSHSLAEVISDQGHFGSREDNSMLKSVLHNSCVRVQVQRIHHPVLMERDGSRGQVEHSSNLFHGLAFGKQLQDLDLTPGERDLLVYAGQRHRIREEFCGLWKTTRKIDISLQHAMQSKQQFRTGGSFWDKS